MRKIHNIIATTLALAGVLTTSCKDERGESEPITRLDLTMNHYCERDSAGRAHLRDSLSAEMGALLEVVGFDELSDSCAWLWASSLPTGIFGPMTEKAYPDLSGIEDTLGMILKNAERHGLEVPKRRYAAVTWGKDRSIVFKDSVALLALNHYLGPESDAYEGWPMYRRQNKRRDMIAYDLAEAITATSYPYEAKEGGEDVLNRMLYEGALTQAKIDLVPDADLGNALGFSREQMEDIAKNREYIWNKMVSGKMLYSSDEELLSKLFDPLPYSTAISTNAPGRTARFTGYEIVKAYLEKHPDASLAFLLSPAFYNDAKSLAESGYNPSLKK